MCAGSSVTEEMIAAGVTVLEELEGAASRAFQAREVFLAMAKCVARPDASQSASDTSRTG